MAGTSGGQKTISSFFEESPPATLTTPKRNREDGQVMTERVINVYEELYARLGMTHSSGKSDSSSDESSSLDNGDDTGPPPAKKKPKADEDQMVNDTRKALVTKASTKQPPRKRTFVRKWLSIPEYKVWLKKTDDGKAFCSFCQCSIRSKADAFNEHLGTKKHKSNAHEWREMKKIQSSQVVKETMTKTKNQSIKTDGLEIADLPASDLALQPDMQLVQPLASQKLPASIEGYIGGYLPASIIDQIVAKVSECIDQKFRIVEDRLERIEQRLGGIENRFDTLESKNVRAG